MSILNNVLHFSPSQRAITLWGVGGASPSGLWIHWSLLGRAHRSTEGGWGVGFIPHPYRYLPPQMSPVRTPHVLSPNSQHCPPSWSCVSRCLAFQPRPYSRLWLRRIPTMVARPQWPPRCCSWMVSMPSEPDLKVSTSPQLSTPFPFSSQGIWIPGMCWV